MPKAEPVSIPDRPICKLFLQICVEFMMKISTLKSSMKISTSLTKPGRDLPLRDTNWDKIKQYNLMIDQLYPPSKRSSMSRVRIMMPQI